MYSVGIGSMCGVDRIGHGWSWSLYGGFHVVSASGEGLEVGWEKIWMLYFRHDTTPRALGLALVGLGISMIAAGAGLFIYDSCVRSLMPGPPRDNAGAAYVSADDLRSFSVNQA